MSGPMQWTPRGMVPAHSVRREPEPDVDDDDDALDGERMVRVPPPVARRPAAAATAKRVNVVALARARLREIKTELRRMRQLERERDELQRLVDAASNHRRPRAVVKNIARAAS